ncbi:integrator complex subunit 14-like isoform X1 [Macrosteles quadrilineatus]|uniref:integrator complex subunit 14-like isoform X1 n=2 Tax=Macrosteles quadrilineatus TaxID=74068 RepID=UPI0023E113EB|nr:integrator complex subunit 14-like isoform X1 [Macrosteles quadrilineatus]XP_054278125.1 integrator complex subunit 14-like isoform X1 [Macrosteles quadrilineatus]
MPTVIVLDVSLSMSLPVTVPDSNETFTSLQLAIHGINSLLDYLSLYSKLEFVALMTYSSSYEVLSTFTRDFEVLKSRLAQCEEQDKSCLVPVLTGVNKLVLGEWGSTTPCQVVLVTNGASRRHSELEALSKIGPFASPLPFAFPGKLSVVVVAPPGPTNPILSQVVRLSGGDGSVMQVDSSLSPQSIYNLFQQLAEKNYASFCGMLKCGNLSSKVILSPAPMPYTKITDFDCQTYSVGSEVGVCGFIDMAHVGNPAAVSRHLVLPFPPSPSPAAAPPIKQDSSDDEDDSSHDEGKTPSFCVLLHGALKVENMVALCQVAPEWYGLLYSWADSKKKSNLMLTLLEPGNNPVPWLGDITQLGTAESDKLNPEETFPVKPTEKRSYSQSNVVWIRQAGLQSDIQKILRHARKLPEKTQHFYKELNRVRRAAISLGFISLLDGLAAILERECTLLPGGAHPDCALQLTHAANVLRKPFSRDPKFSIVPMRTRFHEGDNWLFQPKPQTGVKENLPNPI